MDNEIRKIKEDQRYKFEETNFLFLQNKNKKNKSYFKKIQNKKQNLTEGICNEGLPFKTTQTVAKSLNFIKLSEKMERKITEFAHRLRRKKTLHAETKRASTKKGNLFAVTD